MVDQRSFMWRFTARATLAFQVLATGWFAIYPTLSMAAPPTEAEIQAVMNESQWDGALLLKRQTELPSIVDTDAPPAEADYFTDDTRSNFKNQIVLPDIIRGYSLEATEALRSEIAGMNAAPNTVNEKLVDKDAAFLAASYPENCNDVPLAERADCEHYNARKTISEGKRNSGHNLFLGAIDPIITDSIDDIDGDSIFFDQIASEAQCAELTTDGDDGDAYETLKRREYCVRSLSRPPLLCEAVRDVVTEFVDTKTLFLFDVKPKEICFEFQAEQYCQSYFEQVKEACANGYNATFQYHAYAASWPASICSALGGAHSESAYYNNCVNYYKRPRVNVCADSQLDRLKNIMMAESYGFAASSVTYAHPLFPRPICPPPTSIDHVYESCAEFAVAHVAFCRNTDFYYGPASYQPNFGTRPGCPYLPVTTSYDGYYGTGWRFTFDDTLAENIAEFAPAIQAQCEAKMASMDCDGKTYEATTRDLLDLPDNFYVPDVQPKIKCTGATTCQGPNADIVNACNNFARQLKANCTWHDGYYSSYASGCYYADASWAHGNFLWFGPEIPLKHVNIDACIAWFEGHDCSSMTAREISDAVSQEMISITSLLQPGRLLAPPLACPSMGAAARVELSSVCPTYATRYQTACETSPIFSEHNDCSGSPYDSALAKCQARADTLTPTITDECYTLAPNDVGRILDMTPPSAEAAYCGALDGFEKDICFSMAAVVYEVTKPVCLNSTRAGDPVTGTEVLTVPLVGDHLTYPRGGDEDLFGTTIPTLRNAFNEAQHPAGTSLPYNVRVTGEGIESWRLVTYGRETGKWPIQVEVVANNATEIRVEADLHTVRTDEIVAVDGTDRCQAAIDAFITGAFPGQGTCLEEIGTDRVIHEVGLPPTNIILNQDTMPGHIESLQTWGPNGEPPLAASCWRANLEIDRSSGHGIGGSPEACAGLVGSAYSNCLDGQYCTYDDLNGVEVCTPLENGLALSDPSDGISVDDPWCGKFASRPECQLNAEDTRCSEYEESESGELTCVVQEVAYDCDVEGAGYGVPDATQTQLLCQGILKCAGGECSNIAQEQNADFVTAAAHASMLDNMRSEMNCEDPTDPSTCRLFVGEDKRCKQPQMWGASDCCDPGELGLGGVNAIGYMQAMKYMYELMSNEKVAGYMAKTWTGMTSYLPDAAGAWVDSTTAYVSNGIDAAGSFFAESLTSGWNAMMQTMGFDFAVIGSTATNSALTATSTTYAGTASYASGAATSSAAAYTATTSQSIFTGVSQYVAQGVYNFLEFVAPGMGDAIFTTSASAAGTEVTGFTSEIANEAFTMFMDAVTIIGYIYLAYQIYNLIVGLLYGCDQDDSETVLAVERLACHYVGNYCSDDSFFGCLERTRVHCCYGGPFARIMAEQLRIQDAEAEGKALHEAWKNGATTNPRCDGWTLEEIQEADWDRIDLSEFIQILMSGYMKFNPNEFSEEALSPTQLHAGNVTGPNPNITPSGQMQQRIALTGEGVDYARQHLKDTPLVMTDPDYTRWYERKHAPDPACYLVCADGSSPTVSGECLSTTATSSPATAGCPAPADGDPPYVVDGERCVQTWTEPAIVGCPPEAALIDNGIDPPVCRFGVTDIRTPILTCPPGQTPQMGSGVDRNGDGTISDDEKVMMCQRIDVADVILNCDGYGPGYALVDDRCVNTASTAIEPITTCPEGHTRVGENCERHETADYTYHCANGVYNPVDGSCLRDYTTASPATVACLPPGLLTADGRCITSDVAPLSYSCSSGTLHVDSCVTTITTPSLYHRGCAIDGHKLVDSDTCQGEVEVATVAPHCPWVDYALDGMRCVKNVTTTEPEAYHCDDGEVLVGTTCERNATVDASPTCAPGTQYRAATGVCESTGSDSVPATPTCVTGTLTPEGSCATAISEPPAPFCADGVLNPDTGLCDLGVTAVVAPLYRCADTTMRLVGDRCYAVSNDRSVTCQDGWTYNASMDRCTRTNLVTQPPAAMCDTANGYVLEADGICHQRTSTDASAWCDNAAGFYYNADVRRCTKFVLEEMAPVTFCATGTAPVDGDCVVGHSIPAFVSCPDGFIWDSASASCRRVDIVITDAIPACDTAAGFTLWTHPDQPELILCERLQSFAATLGNCPDGFVQNPVSGLCEGTTSREAGINCTDPAHYNSLFCTAISDAALSCASGVYDPIAKRCVVTATMSPVSQCPPGTISTGPGICDLAPTRAPTCPTGHTFIGGAVDRCAASTSLPATPTCPRAGDSDLKGECGQLRIAAPTCQAGLTWDPLTQDCVRNAAMSSLGLCPFGTDNGTSCDVVDTALPACPSDLYYWDQALEQCVRYQWVDGSPFCPPKAGLVAEQAGDLCHYYQVAEPSPTNACPDNYSYHGGSDMCRRFSDQGGVAYLCPEGTEHPLNADGEPDIFTTQCFIRDEQVGVCDTAAGFAYNSVTKFCTKSYTVPYTASCAPGQIIEDGVCREQDRAARHCPAGWDFSPANNRCEFVDVVPYTYTCPAEGSWSLSGSTCVGSGTVAPTCPSGYIFHASADACARVESAPTCGTGYTYNAVSNLCERPDSIPVAAPCDAGEYDTGTACRAFSSATCPEVEEMLNPTTDRCEGSRYTPPTLGCIPPAVDTGTDCATGINSTPYVPTCTAPYYMSWPDCRLDLDHEPTCPPGMTYSTTANRCEATATNPYNPPCPVAVPAYTQAGGSCKRTLTATPTCGPSRRFDAALDQCVATSPSTPTLQCLIAGYTLVGSTCESKTMTMPSCSGGTFEPATNSCRTLSSSSSSYTCYDSDWILTGDQCTHPTVVEPGVGCPPGFTLDADPAPGTCSRRDLAYPTYQCPPDQALTTDGRHCQATGSTTAPSTGYYCPSPAFTLVGDLCEMPEVHGTISYCADPSFTLSGTTCVRNRVEHANATYSCDTGVLNAWRCELDTTADPFIGCPSDMPLAAATGLCTKSMTATQPAAIVCDESGYIWIGDMCRDTVGVDAERYCSDPLASLIDGRCIRSSGETAAPVTGCVTGSVLNPDTGLCEGTRITSVIFTCPDTSYSFFGSDRSCRRPSTYTAPPTFTCPTGFTLSGMSCTLESSRPAPFGCAPLFTKDPDTGLCTKVDASIRGASVCESGATQRSNRCYETVTAAAVNTCPPDAVDSGTGCLVSTTTVTAAQVECPTGFFPTTTECRKEAPSLLTITCPDPMATLVDRTCYSGATHVVGSAIQTCPTGFTDTGTGCERDSVFPYQPRCPAEYVMNATGMCERETTESYAPYTQCPTGFDFVLGRRCERASVSVEPTMSCLSDLGYELEGSRCIKREEVDQPVGSWCANSARGFELDGSTCVRTRDVPVAWQCSPDQISRGGLCFTETPVYSAPVEMCAHADGAGRWEEASSGCYSSPSGSLDAPPASCVVGATYRYITSSCGAGMMRAVNYVCVAP